MRAPTIAPPAGAESPAGIGPECFSLTGRYIARRLLGRGIAVRTLTGHPERTHAFGDRIVAHPYAFEEPARLAASLDGIHTLFNTYWVRFDRGDRTYDRAVENTRRLPVFAIPGDGSYEIQPVHVDDLAKLAVQCADRSEDLVIDATGAEAYAYVGCRHLSEVAVHYAP